MSIPNTPMSLSPRSTGSDTVRWTYYSYDFKWTVAIWSSDNSAVRAFRIAAYVGIVPWVQIIAFEILFKILPRFFTNCYFSVRNHFHIPEPLEDDWMFPYDPDKYSARLESDLQIKQNHLGAPSAAPSEPIDPRALAGAIQGADGIARPCYEGAAHDEVVSLSDSDESFVVVKAELP